MFSEWPHHRDEACPHNQRDFGYVLTLAELEGGIGVFQRFRNTFDMLDMAVGDLR